MMEREVLLAQEARIVWLRPSGRNLPWLREAVAMAGSPYAKPHPGRGRVVAYGVDAKGRWPALGGALFATRFWYYKPGDLDPDEYLPIEAACPGSIAAGTPSQRPRLIAGPSSHSA